jgi:uncharacterized protein (DUF1499 family)
MLTQSAIMQAMKILMIVLIVGPLAVFALGRLGMLRGSAPSYLGITEGVLAKPALGKTNSVSSQHALPEGSYHQIAPLSFDGDAQAAFSRLRAIATQLPGCVVVRSDPTYLYLQCESQWLRFVDDLEFFLAAKDSLIHVRSASRLGRKDFGVNRSRVETIRHQFIQPV